jgi:LPS-assembly protein
LNKWSYSSAITLFVAVHAASETRTDYSYLDWLYRDELNTEQQSELKAFCAGQYVIFPDDPTLANDNTHTKDPSNQSQQDHLRLHVRANYGEYIDSKSALFTGNVWIKQDERHLFGDSAQYQFQQKNLNLTGNVSFRGSGIVVKGEHIEYSNSGGYGTILDSEFALPGNHLRGYAKTLTLSESGLAELEGAEITFCEPGHNDWSIAASEMRINRTTGRGEAWNARLNVQKVPVLYVPYYQFPLDDRRMTGFLNPELGFSPAKSQLGVQIEHFSAPFYINIAPNYDDTVTPHYYQGKGWLLENEFRYLNATGRGDLRLSYLGQDESTEEERWYRQWKHSKTYGPTYLKWDYTEVSDDDYEDDFGLSEVSNAQQLDQMIEAGISMPRWKSSVKAHSYQVVNRFLAPESHPYRRLPEIQASFQDRDQGWLYGSEILASRFVRGDHERSKLLDSNTDKALVDVLDAKRLGADLFIGYELFKSFGYITSKITAAGRQYQFSQYQDRLKALSFKQDDGFSTLTIEAEAGLYFDRYIDSKRQAAPSGQAYQNTSQLQTLEPRLYFAATTHSDQSKIPLFDTSLAAGSYAQLFSPNDYIGWDRISDTQKVALGVSSKLYDEDSEQILRISIGQAYYFDRGEVQLAPEYRSKAAIAQAKLQESQAQILESQQGIPHALTLDDFKTTPIIAELEWQISDEWHLLNTLEYDPAIEAIRQRRLERESSGVTTNTDPAQYSMDGWKRASLLLGYQDELHRLVNIGLDHTESLNVSPTYQGQALGVSRQQINFSTFLPINDLFALFGQYKYDLTPWHDQDSQRPGQNPGLSDESFSNQQNYDVLESLAGIEYQNCCWRLQLSYQESTKADRTKDYGFLFQIHLKGLGIMGKNSDDLLSERIRSYDKRAIHDY